MKRIVLSVAFVAGLASAALAQESADCQMQLQEVSTQVYNLDVARDQLEREKAKLQVTVYKAQQKIKALEKLVDEFGKSAAEKQPK